MCRLEPVVLEFKPDIVLVYGNVNTTVAAALVCSKLVNSSCLLGIDWAGQ